jgi:hypothetical protein
MVNSSLPKLHVAEAVLAIKGRGRVAPEAAVDAVVTDWKLVLRRLAPSNSASSAVYDKASVISSS